jgi:serine/threonine-protein kinase
MGDLLKGRYAIDGQLGVGGMGEVLAGWALGREGFARRVAVKRILSTYSADPQIRALFTREAQLSARLAHPNVIAVLDFDADEAGGLFLVMEYVDGVSLDALARAPLPVAVAVHIVADLLRGLAHAHGLELPDGTRGLVHRDVSPHNAMVTWAGMTKLGDFGIAKALHAARSRYSVARGKPPYMSPEQLRGESLDGRSDLFSVGAILWELLSGEPVFQRDAPMATIKAVLMDPIPSPRARRPEIPADVEAVTMRLLAREPVHRYESAEAVLAALTTCEDYPKHGPDAVAQVLAARFPGRARAADGAPMAQVLHALAAAAAPFAVPPVAPPALPASQIAAARARGLPTVTEGRGVEPAPRRASRARAAAIAAGVAGASVIGWHLLAVPVAPKPAADPAAAGSASPVAPQPPASRLAAESALAGAVAPQTPASSAVPTGRPAAGAGAAPIAAPAASPKAGLREGAPAAAPVAGPAASPREGAPASDGITGGSSAGSAQMPVGDARARAPGSRRPAPGAIRELDMTPGHGAWTAEELQLAVPRNWR